MAYFYAQVGSRSDSSVYIRMKMKAAAEVGIEVNHIQLPSEVSTCFIGVSVLTYLFIYYLLVYPWRKIRQYI